MSKKSLYFAHKILQIGFITWYALILILSILIFIYSFYTMQSVQGGDYILERIKLLAYGPSKYVAFYNGCNINDFKFYTHEYGYHKIIMNSGVCIKDSW